MTFPKTLKLFRAWAKAMELNAKVDKPDYGKSLKGKKTFKRRRKRFRRKRRKQAD